ncbi:MAG: amino acid ABC transporter ATP-binding protein [Acidimicrobiia bacterium]|nr:amino acid ABC transporter ATP-binding protein [Acidimicrobiia bacterium]
MAFVELRDVHKHFGRNHVLRGVDLDVELHQVICLIGASGCGKSTLLRCINALEEIDGGVITVDGDRVSGPGIDVDAVRAHVGIVFQSFNLFPHLTALENVALAPRKVRRMSTREATSTARELLARVGLVDKADQYPDHLSGGQQQRVAIIRALAMSPRLLLLDEITSALDPELVAEVLDLVRELATDGMTMVLATHEMNFAREVASKICFMHQGTIHEEGPPEVIFSNPEKERTAGFLARIIAAGRL